MSSFCNISIFQRQISFHYRYFFSAEGLYEGDSFIRFDEIDENNEAKREQAIEAAINKGKNGIIFYRQKATVNVWQVCGFLKILVMIFYVRERFLKLEIDIFYASSMLLLTVFM